MKNAKKVEELRAKSVPELKLELGSLRKEQFNLRMQGALGQPIKGHLVRQARKTIARVKTLMNQKVSAK